jgi:hypothetical protein
MIQRIIDLFTPFKFKPYIADFAGREYSEAVRQNAQDFQHNLKTMSNGMDLYERVILELRDNKRVDFIPLRDIPGRNSEDKITVAIRHDVDISLDGALECARILARYGVPGTFYILHTAYYYGFWGEDGGFYRNLELVERLKRFIVHGAELDWLRTNGINIKSTAAHNSAPVYGAENFEIFKGKSARDYFIDKNGIKIPLQVLDESELGLSFEANFPAINKPLSSGRLKAFLNMSGKDSTQSEEWMKIYLTEHPIFTRGYDITCWLNGKDSWIIGSHKTSQDIEYEWDVKTDELLSKFSCQGWNNCKVVFVFHPCYLI